jgi:hypothetical protein
VRVPADHNRPVKVRVEFDTGPLAGVLRVEKFLLVKAGGPGR